MDSNFTFLLPLLYLLTLHMCVKLVPILPLGSLPCSYQIYCWRNLAGAFSDIVELRLRSSNDIALVRPDGYIAYSARNHDGIAALKAVRSVLERQTELGKADVARGTSC